MIKNKFEGLEVWKEAHKLAIMVYKITKDFPFDERFRLVSQICRSVTSIPANIVEGNARVHSSEYLQFLNVARGSLEETRYHLLLAKDLGYLPDSEYEKLILQCNIAGNLLGGLIKYLRSHKLPTS